MSKYTIATTIPKSAKTWLTATIDPYHDTVLEHEGCPDLSTGRSYVRIHNSAFTISPTAEGDNIAVIYSGFHGADNDITATRDTDINGTSIIVRPYVILRAPLGVEPSMATYYGGTATLVQAKGTAFEPDVPSRLIGCAVEVHDVTASLYRKGSMTAVHATGGFQHTDVSREASGAELFFNERCDCAPALPAGLAMMDSYPTVYNGLVAKGIYIVGRMSKPKHPVRFTGGGQYPHAFQWSEANTPASLGDTYCYRRSGANIMALNGGIGMVGSGFQPFAIRMSGLPIEGEYRITIRNIVEYFPEADYLSNLGIATPSPPFCGEAMAAYQQTIITLPTAVPVNMNSQGDYWKIAKAAVARVAPLLLSIAPPLLAAFGQPGLAALTKAADIAVSRSLARRQQKQPQRSTAVQQPKKLVIKRETNKAQNERWNRK